MPVATIQKLYEPDGSKPGKVEFSDGCKASFWWKNGDKPGPVPGSLVVGREYSYEVTTKQNGQYTNHYLGKFSPTAGGGAVAGQSRSTNGGDRDASIVAQVCIKAACDRFSGMETPVSHTLDFARQLFKLHAELVGGQPKQPAPAQAESYDPLDDPEAGL